LELAGCVSRSYDVVEGMHVGTVAAGRIGLAVLPRLKPFDMHLHYFDRHRLAESVERERAPVERPHYDPVRADKRNHGFDRRLSSAWAKYSDALRRFSFACRNQSRIARSIAFIRLSIGVEH
jgi:lactate dehydrogenase-like 2-hydroxyacid dehydrogenase